MGLFHHIKKKEEKHTNKNRFHFRNVWIAVIILCFAVNYLGATKLCLADANSQVNVKINYIDEIATITTGPGNSTKFYLSVDKKKSWELIDSAVDISTLLTSGENVIYFKGNKDEKPVEVTLQGEDKSLEVKYKINYGVGQIDFNTTQPVEYRKGSNGTWKTATNHMSTYYYEVKGATLYFRYPATENKRAGSIVTVKIAKRPSAPSVKLDGSKLYISGLKVGETQYRVGDSLEWKTFTSTDTKTKTIDLSSLLGGSITNNTPIPGGVIEFRTFGGEKKVNSIVKEIKVAGQPTINTTLVNLSGTKLTILDTNTKKTYEYTRVDGNAEFDINKAKWSNITSSRAIIIPKASVGDRIYVREKSYTDPSTKQVIPASTFYVLTVQSITPTTKK